MILYQVLGWSKYFENNKSRDTDQCRYVCVPNKQHGLGFSRIVDEKDGATIYGIWIMILGACSRQKNPREGWMTQDGHPTGTAWTPEDLSIQFRRPEKEIRRALELLASPKVGWIKRMEVTEDGQVALGAPQVPPQCPLGVPEWNGIEEKRKEEKEPESPPFYSEARIILHWLNEKSGSHFREVDANLSIIAARLKSTDGDIEGVKQMVTRQCALWRGDPKTEEWMRPSTLFGPDKFEKYYGTRTKAIAGQQIQQPSNRDRSAHSDRNVIESPA